MIFKQKNKSLSEIEADKITTLIGEDCVIDGVLNSENYIKVDGKILNDMNVKGGIILGIKGLIEGNIQTEEIIVYGKIKGNIKAKKMHLKSSGNILGNIEVEQLQVDYGSVYKGNIITNESEINQSLEHKIDKKAS